MTKTILSTEQLVKKYNNEYRKNGVYKRFDDDKFRVSKPDEENYNKVNIGSKNWGCEIIFKVEEDHLFVSKFKPRSGGMIVTFDNNRAETGFKYLLGLAEVIGSKEIIIEEDIYDNENTKIFRKYGFSIESDGDEYSNGYIMTLNCHDGHLYSLRKLSSAVSLSLGSLKKEMPTLKWNWEKYTDLAYQYSFYAHGINSFFTIELMDGKPHLFELTLGVCVEIENGSLDEIKTFFDEIKEKGKLKTLMKPSDTIFKDMAYRELGLEKKHHKEVFTFLSEVYEQEEMDKRLLEKDVDSNTQHQFYEEEITLSRMLDVYFIYEKKEDSFTFYKQHESEQAKEEFFNKSVDIYKRNLKSQICL